MINNLYDFKNHANKYLCDAWAIASEEDGKNIDELIRIIDLIGCDVICETASGRAFQREIDLNGIINILSVDGKIKKLSEVDFDE